MKKNLSDLAKGETAIIENVSSLQIPTKLLEMGCLPGNKVTLIQKAPFSDPIYLNINDTHLAISKKLAKHILISTDG